MNYKLLRALCLLILISVTSTIISCKGKSANQATTTDNETAEKVSDSVFFKLSLAEWSLNRAIFSGELDPMDFAEKASKMGFTGVEYVTSFYAERIKNAENPEEEMQVILDSLKAKSEKFNVKNLLLMVDGEGDLAASDSVARNKAVEGHKKWIDAAQFLGCHSIRVNLFGSDKEEDWKKNSVDALSRLSKYAANKDINVLVENHGYLSSDADLLVNVIKEVNMENCGTLPDFGNFCLKREGGERWEAKCIEEFPRYEGVDKLMDYAKAVSAKSYTFDEEGNEELIDYKKMLQIVKDAGYTGYIGIEFEGTDISAEKGINATRDLLLKAGNQL